MPPTLGASWYWGGGLGLHVQLCWFGVLDVSFHTCVRVCVCVCVYVLAHV